MLTQQFYMKGRLRYRGVVLFVLLCAALVPVYFVTAAPGLTWRNNGADSGDLGAAAAVVGVAHPTGYPTYLILASLFQHLPLGALAFRTTVLSMVCAVLTSGLTLLIVQRTYAGPRRFAWVGGAAAGFAFGLSPLLWSQAVITEVYALHTLFVAALVLLTLLAVTPGPRSQWAVRLGGLVFGLALGNHLTTVLILPIWFYLIGWRDRRLQWRPILESIVGLMLGGLVYLYIPLRAATHPPVNWGGADNWEGFWWLVTGQGYRGLLFGLPPNLLFTRLGAWAGLTLAQVSWPGFLVALYGLLFGSFRPSAPRLLTGWIALTYSIFAIGHGTSASSAYLLPAFLALAIWFGIGLATLLQELTGPWTSLRPALLALTFLILFANAVHQLPSLDASRDTAAEDFGRAVLAQAPPNAILITTADHDTFVMWFYQYALGQRPDVVVLDEPLWPNLWYRENLAYTYPGLILPKGLEPPLAEFLAATHRPQCRTQPDSQPPLVCNESP